MAPAPGMGDREPDQQVVAAGEAGQANNNQPAFSDGRVLLPADAKRGIRDWAERAKGSGLDKVKARTTFRDLHEDDVAQGLSARAVDHVFDQVYGEDEDTQVEKALEKLRVQHKAREQFEIEQSGRPDGFEVLSAEDILALDDPTWLVDGLLPSQGTFQVYGDSNTGKSFVVLDLLLCIASGQRWLDHFPVNETGQAVYVAAEGGFDLKDRVAAWMGERHSGQVPYAFAAIVEQGIDLRYERDVDQLLDRLQEYAPVAVVFDTWALHMPGGDENSAKDVGRVIAALKRMATDLDALVGTVHHTGKDVERGARGSSAMRAAWDVEFHMTGTQLVHTKARSSVKHDVIGIEMQTIDLGNGRTSLVPKRVEALAAAAAAGLATERQLLDAVRAMNGSKWTPIRTALGGNPRRWQIVRDGLIQAGRLENRDGCYFLIEDDE